MDQLIEILQQIQDLAGVALDGLQGAEQGGPPGGPPPEAGGPPEGAPPEGPPQG